MSRSRPGPEQPSAGAGPPTGERVDLLDVLRGTALAGVLLVNSLHFAGPAGDVDPLLTSTTSLDRGAELLVRLGAEGAFYSIFSLLFGVGISMQLARGRRWLASRMAVLFLLGLGHRILLWEGDILIPYAGAGLVALAFVRLTPRSLLRWAVGLASGSLTILGAIVGGSLLISRAATSPVDVDATIAAHHSTDYLEAVITRLNDLPEDLLWIILLTPWFLAIFLIGLWLNSGGRLLSYATDNHQLRAIIKISLPTAVAAKACLAAMILFGEGPTAATLGWIVSLYLGGAALGATYAAGISWLLIHPSGVTVRLLSPLRAVGRMSLTNYLSQSLVALLVFERAGLGLYGVFGVGATVAMAAGLFTVQIGLSNCWLAWRSMGPMESAWRSLTRGLSRCVSASIAASLPTAREADVPGQSVVYDRRGQAARGAPQGWGAGGHVGLGGHVGAGTPSASRISATQTAAGARPDHER